MLLQLAGGDEPTLFRLQLQARQFRLPCECRLQLFTGIRPVHFGRGQLVLERSSLARQRVELPFALLHRCPQRRQPTARFGFLAAALPACCKGRTATCCRTTTGRWR